MNEWKDGGMHGCIDLCTHAYMHLCMYLSNECMYLSNECTYECMYMSNIHRLSIDPFSRCKLKVKIFTYV